MKNLSDEKIDQLFKRIVKDSAMSNEAIDEIADSPQLLWNVRRSIAAQNASVKKSWFAALSWRIPAVASLSLLVCFGVFWSVSFDRSNDVADINAVETAAPEKVDIPEKFAETAPVNEVVENNSAKKVEQREKIVEKSGAIRSVSLKSESKKAANSTPKSLEIANNATQKETLKTEFIALSYSSEADSGHILNVKVPRSMMVSLGVTSNVENISELVNAEVVMGDDGLARAIRFVQEN